MSQHHDRADQRSSGQSSGVDQIDQIDQVNAAPGWSKLKTRLASLVILGFLFILILGPLSNPVASPYLSGPIAAKVSPLHRALFLGHGYRFFGPDPGPGHLLVYQGQKADGTKFEGVFPDSDSHWPRLLYHRWFMLSETLFNEHALLLSEPEFNLRVEEYKRQISDYQEAGKLQFAIELIRERDLEAQQYHESRRRVELLGHAVAKVLAKRNDASSIKLFMQVRQIPLAEEVASGVELDEPALLSQLLPIGELDGQLKADDYRVISPYAVDQQSPQNNGQETLPAMEVLQ